MQKIVVLLGPTGVGKTALSLALAHRLHSGLINADSRQVYHELSIGTDRPSPERFVGIPHFLFGTVSINQEWNAATFQQHADAAIAELCRAGVLPLVVGGTGLYLRALLHGLFEGPKSDPGIRQALEQRIQLEGLGALYQELTEIDPETPSRLHPHDRIRIIRALEVYQLTGQSIFKQQQAHGFGIERYDALKIGLTLPRGVLYQRINDRVLQMIESGLEDEVRGLFAQCAEHPLLMNAIGYKEWVPYLKGQTSREQVVARIQQNSRRFAKRQLTWFRREVGVKWFSTDEWDAIARTINQFLGGE